ncbi:MAG: hypothetical protein GKC10_01965, partial [Methanosarcinales archaeon]|nr:hypothetical protein [Methanosarcinales archaeon]
MKGLYPLVLMTVLLLLAGACPAMAEGNEIGMDERQGLEQSGFSVDLPPSWTVDFSGNFSSGSLRANDSSLSYAMVWMRDPGSDPDELLDLVERTYQGTDLAVTSANFEEILAGVGKGNLLQLQYTFKGHPAQKLFASWRSEHSDRLFTASCYSLKGGDLSGMAEDFKSIIGSFSDREVVQSLTSRATTDDAWAIVLQDVLSSRSFARPISLIGGSVGIEVGFRGGMEDGVYRVVSEDDFTASMPEEVYVRPAAVQEFLQDQGYQALLVQNRGRVYVAVIDPQGLAQAVSPSPVQPLEMVGVVLNEDGSDSLQGT